MRDITPQTTVWELCSLDVQGLQVWQCQHVNQQGDHPTWQYQLSCLEKQESFWYLHAKEYENDQVFVLGCFDTRGQADFFLALHSMNPLNVPALVALDQGWPALLERDIQQPVYAGTYRVGFKSYRVEKDPDSGLLSLAYVDRYHTDYLGLATEKEACLLIYSHFDARLRGCKMC